MSYTDPGGFSLRRLLRGAAKFAGVSIAIGAGNAFNVATMYSKPVRRVFLKYQWARVGLQVSAGYVDMFLGGGIFSAASSAYLTDISGGSTKDVLKAAVIAGGASYYGMQVGGDWAIAYKMLAKGAIGAAAAKASGGKVSDGFWSGALSALAPGYKGATGYITGAIYNGLVAEITGGKFEYGAGASLFGRMLGDLSSSGGSTCGTNPINIATGEKYLTMLDYKASGASKLKFERYYSSYAKNKTALGYGWRSNFDTHLSFAAGAKLGVANKVFYTKQNREQVEFSKNAQGTWQASNHDLEQLLKTGQNWQVTTEEGVVETYNLQGQLLTVQYRGGYTQTLSYNSKAQLVEVSDSFKAKLQLAYNRHGLLKSVTDPEGNRTHYRYDISKQVLSKVLYPTKAESDNDDALAQSQSFKQYHYDDPRFTHAITSITNELGQTVHNMAYDDFGRAILSELGDHMERYDVTFINNYQSTVRNSLGRETTYAFNKDNKPISIEGHATASCYGSNQGYTYDERGNILTKTDWNGTLTSYTYNERNLKIQRIEAQGTEFERVIKTQWHEQYRLPVQITTPGLTTEYVYNDKGLLIEKTEYDTLAELNTLEKWFAMYPSRTTQFGYNAQGLLTEVDDSLAGESDITLFSYDEKGNQTSVTNALAHTSQITEFDNNGKPLVVIDANNIEIHLAYNSRGWLQSKTVKGPEGDAITYYTYAHSGNYKGQGQIASVTLPNGKQVNYDYDKAYRVIGIHNTNGESISYTLDLEGNRVAETTRNNQGELVRSQRRVFDELSRLLSSIGANNQSSHYRYDQSGNLAAITDPLQNKTAYAFDALNRLVATTDANDGLIKQSYTVQGRLKSVTDQRGLTTEYQYNGFGEKIAQISPDTGTTTYAYNKAGKLISKTDARNVSTEYAYDVIGRVTDIHYPAANASEYEASEYETSDIHYVYDQQLTGTDNTLYENNVGRLAQVIDQSGQTQYSYNPQGKVKAKVYSIGETTYRTENHFNKIGGLMAITYPSGRVVNYQHNALGKVTGVTTQLANATSQTVVSNISYLPFGPIKGIAYGNHTQLNISRDLDYRISDINLRDSANDVSFYDVHYAYDNASNITHITDQLNSAKSQQFDYDNLYRLTNAQGSYGEVGYDYDSVGNRLQRRIETREAENMLETYDYAHDSNRLVTVAKHSAGDTNERLFAYDAVGNIVNDARGNGTDSNNLALIYGANNRLQGVNNEQDTEQNVSYRYNAKGQRVSKSRKHDDGSLEVIHFHYNEAGQLMAETNGAGEAISEYVYVGNERIAKVDYEFDAAGSLVFIHNDHLGSPQLMTDEFRRVVWRSDTLPFGQSVEMVDDEKQKLRFPGQYFDGESGYAYNYFRDYDASLGRYVQFDPIGLRGGINGFGYVGNKPLSLVDPLGLFGWSSGTSVQLTGIVGYGFTGGTNGQFFSDGSVGAYGVAGTGWGFDIGVDAQVNGAVYLLPGEGGTASWGGLFRSINVSAFGGTASFFWGGGWFGVSGGGATDGGAFSITETQYVPITESSNPKSNDLLLALKPEKASSLSCPAQ